MDPLTVIGLAGNILQFVDSAFKIVKEAKNIYKRVDGSTDAARNLRSLLQDIQNISDQMKKQAILLPADELSRLQVPKDAKSKAFESLRVSTLISINRSKVENLLTRLKELDNDMRYRLQNMLSDGRQSSVLKLLRKLENENRNLGLEVSCKLDTIISQICQSPASQNENALEAIVLNLSKLDKVKEYLVADQALLKSLVYTEIKQRQAEILDAHAESLQWLFDPSYTQFHPWLEGGNGMFWVSGLPGSGKSTMMKFACSHPLKNKALGTWARDRRLFTGSYFFLESRDYHAKVTVRPATKLDVSNLKN
jgi:type II secretory ATPase GspE/PulE/Tfp pilus assembly ATPase PilB-like protein